ncbi:MAG: phosphodiesterase, partial [Oscillospiraceae bacterium]
MFSYPDYNNGIINIISSIRKYYRTSAAYPTLKELDRCLNRFYKNIVLIMMNGMGKDILCNTLEK